MKTLEKNLFSISGCSLFIFTNFANSFFNRKKITVQKLIGFRPTCPIMNAIDVIAVPFYVLVNGKGNYQKQDTINKGGKYGNLIKNLPTFFADCRQISIFCRFFRKKSATSLARTQQRCRMSPFIVCRFTAFFTGLPFFRSTNDKKW